MFLVIKVNCLNMFQLSLFHNDLDLDHHKLYMASKRDSMKIDDGEWQFGTDIV